MRFAELADASQRVGSTRSRLEKKRIFASVLGKASKGEVAAAVGWLIAEPLCGPLGVGPAQLWALSRTAAPAEATASLGEVEEALRVAKEGPRDDVPARVAELFAKLTSPERALFVGALTGSLRQGSLGGVMLLALVDLSGASEATVRRAAMVTGSVPKAAEALTSGGAPPSALTLFQPIAPMLASPAESLEDAFVNAASEAGPLLVEWKVDGLRAQVHKAGSRVAVYSRQGNDLTSGCGPVLEALAALASESAVVDGEIVLVDATGVARPFQDTFSAIASKGPAREGDRLRVYLFDCMHVGGRDLLDEPLSARRDRLAEIAPADLRMPAAGIATVDEAKAFEKGARGAGHEGVMVKDLASPYRSGARGRAWQKVKEFATVDLVVLAAEWGHGRRKGFLSNLHLGARRDDGTFCMVGKTFKGLTDAMLLWQTERLQTLAVEKGEHVVVVRPELVVEIRYSDVQRSPRYPGGVALRFARVVRYREDKPAGDADPLAGLVARAPDAPDKPTAKPRGKAGAKTDTRQLSLFEEGKGR